MDNSLATHSTSLIERLESKPEQIGRDNPFYWYFHLKEIGKQAQTKEMVEEAINSFTASNHAYRILEVVSKRHITKEICTVAVSRNGLNLKHVPNQYRDEDICLLAVQNDGGALKDVPDQILHGEKGFEICLAAVSNDFEGLALSFVPENYLHGKKGNILCEAAVRANGYALGYVPKRLVTKKLAKLAIETPFPVREEQNLDGSSTTKSANDILRVFRHVLALVPEEYMSEDLVHLSARLYPESLQYAPTKFVSNDLYLELVDLDPMNLRYIPMPDKQLVEHALDATPRAILAVPEYLLTMELCRNALRRDPTIPIKGFPEDIRTQLEKEFQSDAFIGYEPFALETPAPSNQDEQALSYSKEPYTHDLTSANSSEKPIYYISDIHLEHQLTKQPHDIESLSLPEIRERIDNKITELLASAPENTSNTLLIGGDVADSIELEALFYEQLTSFSGHHRGWPGRIIAVLGNHELWDGDPMGLRGVRPVDEIIADYRQAMPRRVTILENELYIIYKGLRRVILDEETILNASTEELAEACANSTFVLLGGIGFSGLNPIYNAKMGLYRAAVSTEEDISRSRRFRAIYEKVLASAENLPVIVLTHMQMANWSDDQYNPRWIYVSGHTHQNMFLLQHDGTSVFSDNQIGYKPQSWHLNSFKIDARRYDPFKNYPNGIHPVTREQYIEFNRCMGINMQSMRHPGNLFFLKHDGAYMFVLQSEKSLCLLEGGRRHKLDKNIVYYYNNFPKYVRNVRGAFEPYQKALAMVSDEVRAIGGSGYAHGCIVDIDFYNHVYLNPFDGQLTPYYALNTTEKMVFEDMESLLQSSPIPPQLSNGESMLVRYRDTPSKEKKLPILSRRCGGKWELAAIPQVVLDKSMYEPSRIFRSIQYVFEQNVVRVWNDAILAIDDDNDPLTLHCGNQLPDSWYQ